MVKSLLMIHGVGCSGSVWDRMRTGFEAAGYVCDAPTLFPDMRTVTDPPEALGRLSLEDYVTTMSEAAGRLTERHGSPPVVIGHSMGGLIAQRLTERGEVAAGIFLTPAQPAGCTVRDLRVLRTFWSIVRHGPGALPGKALKVGPKGFSWGVLNVVPKSRHAEIYADARYDSGQVYADLTDPPSIETDRIRVPTLTIGARRDRATPVKAVRKTAEKYAEAPVPGDYLEYSDHAHWIVDEPGTDRVIADIVDWLSRKLPTKEEPAPPAA